MSTPQASTDQQPRKYQLFINGQFIDAQSGKTFTTPNPATGEVLAEVAEADAVDVDLAVQAARRAFESGKWAKMSARDRGRRLDRHHPALVPRPLQGRGGSSSGS